MQQQQQHGTISPHHAQLAPSPMLEQQQQQQHPFVVDRQSQLLHQQHLHQQQERLRRFQEQLALRDRYNAGGGNTKIVEQNLGGGDRRQEESPAAEGGECCETTHTAFGFKILPMLGNNFMRNRDGGAAAGSMDSANNRQVRPVAHYATSRVEI